MIEFNGCLSGEAEKFFHKKSTQMAQKLILFAMLVIMPVPLFYSVIFKINFLTYFCVITCVLAPLAAVIPRSKKEKHTMTPKRIYVDGDCITCIADKYVETKLVSDVTKVYDHGAFYELRFPFGKISEKFICQKDLLICGSLSDFESLFGDKLEKSQVE